MTGWDAVKEAAETARCIAYDGCHKIYFAMDDEEVTRFRDLGYGEDGSNLIEGVTPVQYLYWAKKWYENSCGLKFISSVRTNEDDPNAGFTSLIPQGWLSDEWIDIMEAKV
jgi:hypothetical protein